MPPSDQDEQPTRARRQPLCAAAGASAPPEILAFALRPEWSAASLARERVTRWLDALRWPPAQGDDLVLAVNEAVSNSVEHGYLVTPDDIDVPGSIRVEARLVPGLHHTRSAVFTVRDGGRWREPRADDPHRGHGLHIMRSCVSELSIETTRLGTIVTMISRPAPVLSRLG
jgi:anti-sigma regulatory factor (Ser/Thr protein kinase)